MRLGVGLAHGRYRPRALTSSGSTIGPRHATVFNVEGEYAFGYTRVSGEWILNRFETPAGTATAQASASGTAVARGFNVQAAQTLSPRLFAAVRATRVSSPVAAGPAEARRTSTALEATIGYRLSPELTVRGGYQREREYSAARWRNAAVLSVVWAERWW
jgi:predicted porin